MAIDTITEAAKMQPENRDDVLHQAADKMLAVLPRIFKHVKSECRGRMPQELTDIGDAQFRLVHILSHEDSSMTELARRMEVAAPTVSRMVDGLVARGLVERRPDPDDRRIIWLTLSRHGREVAAQAERIFREAVAGLMSKLRDEQLHRVIAGLNELEALISTQTPTTRREEN